MKRGTFLTMLVLWNLLSQAQSIPKHVHKNVTNRYSEQGTNIRSVLDIDGYYLVNILYQAEGRTHYDTTAQKIAFFEDGSARLSYSTKPVQLRNSFFVSDQTCGIYRLSGDSIIFQEIYFMPGKMGNARWGAYEQAYKILDRTIILPLYTKALCCGEQTKKINYPYSVPSHFTPSKDIPTSDCWLKKVNWMWEQ